ncbi:ankyrin repeat-containing ITN1-like [Olea europaea subsp. europaea]|uniref:Ankyrin repeat-containing ITN1-like n=1 Tax=Olea europaea subsp. europaea TaxID=158383 RepID=A0A8S0PD34_OLEEU|nr:ankyrin repeat-containing ITN1-like [Olea europaea subsp. europaea]
MEKMELPHVRLINTNVTNFDYVVNVEDDQSWSLPLYNALLQGDWEIVEAIIKQEKEAITARLTAFAETPLLVAVKGGKRLPFIKKLVDFMPPEALALTDYFGNTGLHAVAVLGNVPAAKLFVRKNQELPNIWNIDGSLPIHLAAMRGHRDMTLYLFSVTREDEYSDPSKDEAGATLLNFVINAGFYDLALHLLEHNPKLAWQGTSPLDLMAEEPSAFLSGEHLTIWQNLIYSSPPLKRIRHRKFMHHQALQLVKCVCSEIKSLDNTKANSILTGPFLLGAQNGINEIVKEILESFPHAITFLDEENHSVFHLAVMYRHEKIFKIVHQQSGQYKMSLALLLDNRRNNILHLVGYKACLDRLDLKPGAVLQMQRELQWYKEVEKFVLPQERKSKNSDGKTPLTIFNEEHREMAAYETQWIISMATSCTVAASLIATVAFAAAITVPGGNHSDGLPIFSKRSSFIAFAVGDFLALLSSITSVISFLSIFTTRYAVNDFLYSLPNRLIIGLISLFLSVAFLMIAFSSTIYLVFAQKNSLILIPIIILTCVPVTLFTYLQLPPLLNMIKSTHGPSIFG